jgi:hypothetical protein
MGQARCAGGKHGNQEPGTSLRSRRKLERVCPPPEGHTQKEKSHTEKAPDTTQRRACLTLIAGVMMTADPFGDD